MHGEGATGGKNFAIPNGVTRQYSRRISEDQFSRGGWVVDGWWVNGGLVVVDGGGWVMNVQ